MVRPRFVTRILLLLLVAGGPAGAAPEADVPADARPFESLLASAAKAEPGTYVLNGAALVPVPEGSRIPVLVQADVLRGPERAARVGLVVGAAADQPMEARVLVSTVAAGGLAGRVVADAGGKAAAGPLRLVRELSLEPGDYDVQALVGDARQGTGLLAVARSRLTVPDIRAGALVATPIVVGEAGNAPAAPPVLFVFGQTALTPAVDPHLKQGGAISVAFRIYNWKAAAEEKPDLTVEYLFYEQGQRGLHFFNKVKPQQLNGETLGPSYDPSAGSVAAGMRIPLAAFTFGEFQLLVRVTDNRGGKTVEQTLRFSVVP